MRVLDPTHEQDASASQPARRLPSLRGATLGIITNGKEGTSAFFDQVARLLEERHGISAVEVRRKASYSAPAETEILDEAKRWTAVLTGVGD